MRSASRGFLPGDESGNEQGAAGQFPGIDEGFHAFGRITVKKYQSIKRVIEDDWSHEHIELLPLNRDYNPIIVTPYEAPEMVVVGEWVSSID